MRVALTRAVSSSIGRCELTHLEREPIDLERARAQHRAYEDCLRRLGCRIERLPEEPELADSVFVEDVAVVLPELAVITRPGAASRRSERQSIARALAAYRRLADVRSPAVLDGGDVLVLGKTIWVGLSSRSNREAVRQLDELLDGRGYEVRPVEFGGCLHLKSAATSVGQETVLLNPDWVDRSAFRGARVIEVERSEPRAANVLPIGGSVLFGAEYPRTGARLEAAGFRPLGVDASELAKAEGALTCCSLVFDVDQTAAAGARGTRGVETIRPIDP